MWDVQALWGGFQNWNTEPRKLKISPKNCISLLSKILLISLKRWNTLKFRGNCQTVGWVWSIFINLTPRSTPLARVSEKEALSKWDRKGAHLLLLLRSSCLTGSCCDRTDLTRPGRRAAGITTFRLQGIRAVEIFSFLFLGEASTFGVRSWLEIVFFFCVFVARFWDSLSGQLLAELIQKGVVSGPVLANCLVEGSFSSSRHHLQLDCFVWTDGDCHQNLAHFLSKLSTIFLLFASCLFIYWIYSVNLIKDRFFCQLMAW